MTQHKKKKILVFSVPFSGHLNVLKKMILEYSSEFDFHLIITGWKNIKPDLNSIKTKTLLNDGKLHETDPALWTFPRCSHLLAKCIKITKDIKPDLIIYDFFSIEGYFTGKLCNIPSWCSIPAFIGPSNKEYLKSKISSNNNRKAIDRLNKEFKININENDLETISDGIYIPSKLNLVWSYKEITPSNFIENRKKEEYVFIGNLSDSERIQNTEKKCPLVYFSLGTVVMNNLWNQQIQVRRNLKEFILKLSKLWKNKNIKILFVSQGKKILKKYPDNWQVLDNVDQIDMLSKADLFITHGGSNSFHEAILKKVPMITIPFFGDQILVGKRVEELKIGIDLIKDNNIDTKKSKDFLNSLPEILDKAVFSILKNKQYKKNYNKLKLSSYPLLNILRGKIQFNEGDLLYGTNIARKKYIDETNANKEFRISEFLPFFKLANHKKSLPRIIDIYHDSVRDNEFYSKDIKSELNPYTKYLRAYKKYLKGEKDLCKMCIKGLDFFSRYFKIHFILDNYNPDKNYITTKEIAYVLKNESRFKDSVIFYRKISNTWIPLSYEEVKDYVNYLKKRKKIILISGKRYYGKSTLSKLINEELIKKDIKSSIMSTSRLLKEKFCKINKLNLEKFMNNRKYKERYRLELTRFVTKFSKQHNLKEFIKRLKSSLKEFDIIIIDDLRTKYDFNILKQFKSVTIRINADEQILKNRGHKNGNYDKLTIEKELDNAKFDFIINNNNSLASLREEAISILESLLIK